MSVADVRNGGNFGVTKFLNSGNIFINAKTDSLAMFRVFDWWLDLHLPDNFVYSHTKRCFRISSSKITKATKVRFTFNSSNKLLISRVGVHGSHGLQ